MSVRAATYLGPATEYELVSGSGENLLVSGSSTSAAAAAPQGERLVVSRRREYCFVVD